MSFLKYHDFISKNKQALEKFVVNSPDFTRERKLGLVHTVGHILFLALERNLNGYEITSQNYFSQFNNVDQAIVRSSLCEARGKINWEAFSYLLDQLNQENASNFSNLKWRGHNVKAVDGTFLTLPASAEVLENYPRRNGVNAHYPNGLLVTALNVFTGQPLCAVFDKDTGSERGSLNKLLDKFETGDVLLLDRGYEGVEHFSNIDQRGLFFIARMRSAGTSRNKTLVKFIESKKKTAQITLFSGGGKQSLKLRLIKFGVDREGKQIILATNLMGRNGYPKSEIKKIYFRRWKVETMYYRVKEILRLEKFHAKTTNGVLQEIWANLVVLSLTALMRSCAKNANGCPNFKASIEVVRRNFYLFVTSGNPLPSLKTRQLIKSIFEQIRKIRCKKQKGRKNPRISKQPRTTWANGVKNKLKEKYIKRSRSSPPA